MSDIVLKNWHQLDFKIKNPLKDLKKIDSIMEELTLKKLVSKWFFCLRHQIKRQQLELGCIH